MATSETIAQLPVTDWATTLEVVTRADISTNEAVDYYSKWAHRYDDDITTTVFKGPHLTAQQLNDFCKEDRKTVKILDIAAGTGALGKLANSLGFENIDALDPCENMLKVAKDTGVYREFYKDYMGKNKLPIEDNTYDYIITSGSMLPGHCNEDCFDEIIRLLKPGALFIFSMWEKYATTAPEWNTRFLLHLNEFEKQGKWEILKKLLKQYYMLDSEYTGSVYAIKIKK